MTKSICFIFAAGLALAAVASAEIAEEETFAEATSFVQAFMAEQSTVNKGGDSACLKVADDAIKVIHDECKALQGVIDTAATGNQKCCHSGAISSCKAKAAHLSSITAHSTCLSQLAEIKKKTVNLGSASYSSLAGKTCNGQVVVPKNSAFEAIKSEVGKKTTECAEKKGSKATAKKLYDDAVKAAASSRTTCNEDGQTALTKAFAQGKAACGSATNLKAFKRAEHMKCVLKGTKLADCSKNMPKPPAVKETTLSTLKCAAQTAGKGQCLKQWYHWGGRPLYKVRVWTSLYGPMVRTKEEYKKDIGPSSFVRACAAHGLQPLCDINQNGHVTSDCRIKGCPVQCYNSGQSSYYFSDPAGNARVGFDPAKSKDIFWFNGRSGTGSMIYRSGVGHSTAQASDRDGYTMCVGDPD